VSVCDIVNHRYDKHTLHPSHSFLTELRTFMPRACSRDCIDVDVDVEVVDAGSCGRHWLRVRREFVVAVKIVRRVAVVFGMVVEEGRRSARRRRQVAKVDMMSG